MGPTFHEVTSWTKAGGGQIQDIVLDPTDYHTVYVIDFEHVWRGTNMGVDGQEQWQDVSGNLSDLGIGADSADDRSASPPSQLGGQRTHRTANAMNENGLAGD